MRTRSIEANNRKNTRSTEARKRARELQQVRRAIMRVAQHATNGEVSAADLTNPARGVSARSRGSLVTTAFLSLVREGRLAVTRRQVRNARSRSRVRVYRAAP